MKKMLVFAAALLIAAYAVNSPAAPGSKGKSGGNKGKTGTMSVQVREVIVKSTPNYMGASSGKLSYGTEVSVIGEQENWYQIDKPAGWLPKSALSKHKVKVNPEQKVAGKSVSHDEVALAGKGFNPQVEAQYKKDNADLRAAYATVDQIEDFTASDAELRQFQTAGKLKTR